MICEAGTSLSPEPRVRAVKVEKVLGIGQQNIGGEHHWIGSGYTRIERRYHSLGLGCRAGNARLSPPSTDSNAIAPTAACEFSLALS